MKNSLALIILLFPCFLHAAPHCPGKVIQVLDWPSKCSGNIAFNLDSTSGKWICALSEKSTSMVLTAYATGATIVARLNNKNCENVEHYHKPLYIILKN